MSKILVALVLGIGLLFAVTPAQSQQTVTCPPGQTLVGAYCQTPPPGCLKLPAKMALLRATFRTRPPTIDILALITRRASGRVRISVQAASRFTRFTAPINAEFGYIKTVHRVLQSQANLGTGIVTIVYDGDADTRPQTLRLRTAQNKANLVATRPTLSAAGILRTSGTVTRRAQGVVRIELQYVRSSDGVTVTLQFRATIRNGRWRLNTRLSASVLAAIAARCGTLHSYVAFTGYIPERIRGESRSFQVLGAR